MRNVKSRFCFLVSINFSVCMAQMNLAPNPSFEQYDTCPTGIGQMSKAIPWFNPHYIPICGSGSPDYLNQCSGASGAGVPNNGFGNELARTGVGYAGIYSMNLPWINAREYMEAPLTDTLLAGKEYVVSFYVSLAEVMGYATNKIGAYFSDSAIVNSCDSLLPFVPQIVNQQSNFLTNKSSWTLVRDTFMAAGIERYIIIGNFFPLSQSDTIYVGGGTWGDNCCAYYYIDDVSVIPLDSLSGMNEYGYVSKIQIYPNPTKEEVNIQIIGSNLSTREEKYILRMKNSVGQVVLRKEFYKHIKIDTSQFPKGLYLMEVCTSEGQLCHTGKTILE